MPEVFECRAYAVLLPSLFTRPSSGLWRWDAGCRLFLGAVPTVKAGEPAVAVEGFFALAGSYNVEARRAHLALLIATASWASVLNGGVAIALAGLGF
jgi:hypothetical protein